MEKSYAMIAQELNNAQASLNTAQEKLAKLQAVLTAANAAINGRSH
jgi:F0F1-type ATP synthase membrane subunit b/b'